MINRIFKIVNTSFFPEIYSVEYELKKQSVLRWILGSLMVLRYSQIVNAAQYLPYFEDQYIIGIGTLLLIVLYTIGFALPLVTFLLMFAMTAFEQTYDCRTLGTNILSTYLFVTLFTGAGRFYSVDALLLKSRHFLFEPVRLLYKWIGVPSSKQLKVFYFFGFVSYAVVSFCALSYHLMDKNWMEGTTPFLFFPAAYLSKFYYLFRDLQMNYPAFFMGFSVFSIIGQSIFQFLMIPLMWHKWGRMFVIVWGFGFFLASLFLINLSYLPHVEIVSWLVYFTRVRVKEPYILLFDDRCNFCRKSIRVLRFINFNGLLEFTPISQSKEILSNYNLDETEVKVWMYGIRGREVLKGYDLYYKIVFKNPVLWLLIPVFVIGKYTKLGYKIYAIIAKNRYTIFGTCELTVPKESRFSELNVMPNVITNYCVIVLICLYSTYLSFQLPIVGRQVQYYVCRVHLGFLLPVADYALTWGGFVTPIVFNETDLKLNERFFNLYRVYDGKRELVNLVDEQGGRLDYFSDSDWCFLSNHGSGLLYYSLVLQYQRAMIDQAIVKFHSGNNQGAAIMRKVIMFDKRYLERNDPKKLESMNGYDLIVFENKCVSSLDINRFHNKIIYKQYFSK